MTTFQAWVFVRYFLRAWLVLAQLRGSTSDRYLKVSKAIAFIDASLGYADGVAVEKSRLDAWHICRQVTMRRAVYVPQPIRFRQKPFHFRLRDAVWVLDAVFGFDDKGLPFQCRYHGRLSREDVNYGHIDGVYTELCPHCGREAFHLFFV